MGASSAHGPGGRDEDPARCPGEPDGEASAWEPVITRPDPMSADEWQAWLDCEPAEDSDPEAYPDEEDYLSPDAELTEAELAGIAEATRLAADEADPAGVARVLAAQAAAASARRRGPGQPGSARLLAGESSSRAAAFGTGMCLDVMPACPDLVLLADRAAGPGDSYAGASDDELIGVLCAWDRTESHAHARKLAAVTELRRRRAAIEPPASGREPGSRDEDFLADEIAHALGESRRAADGLAAVAEALDGKLPGTRAALLDGIISPAKARIIATGTALLDDGEARAAEDKVLDRAGRITPGSLRDAIARAVMEVAPEKAKKRRENAAKSARVERWGEDSGNGALAGRELPLAQVLAMDQRITWWARQLRTAGLEGDMDQLRARALTDLVTGTDSRPGHHGTDPGLFPAGFAANVNLTVPLATTTGRADRPGELSGFGPIDPWLARDLARAAAANPKTTWCVTFTDQQGHATGHGCARPAPTNHSKNGNHGRGGKRDGPGPPPGRTGIRDGPAFSFTPPAATGHQAATAPGSCRSPAGNCSSPSTPSPPRTATTSTKPRDTIPASSSATSPRSGTPPAPARSAADPPPPATSSTTFPMKRAGGRACAMAAQSVATTIASSSTPGGRSSSIPTGPSGGPHPPDGPTPPNPPGTRSSCREDSQRTATGLRFAASRWVGRRRDRRAWR
jgi:hypothetical protein